MDAAELVPERRTDTNTAAVLRLAREGIAACEPLEPAPVDRELGELAAEVGWSLGELIACLRVALSLDGTAARLGGSIASLGKATCIERIDAAIDVLGSPENPILGPAGGAA